MSQISRRRSSFTAAAALILVSSVLGALGACSAVDDPVDSEDLQGASESADFAITEDVAQGATLRTTANLNLRSGPSTSKSILRVIPEGATVKAVDPNPSSGFYKVDHNGTVGWAYGKYLVVEADGSIDGSVPQGDALEATANLNMRSGPGTSYSIIEVLPDGALVSVLDPTPQNGFYNISHSGNVGWASGKYLAPAGQGGDSGSSGGVRDEAIKRAQSAMGFSYWWGHGRFKVEGSSASTAGSCSGSCPSCSHSGSWGGDCSGLVAKVWQVPSSNTDLTADSHPYATSTFVKDSSQWSTLSRSNVMKGDALVYNSGGAGHIFVYSSGDAWNTMYAYECKGCSYGCVYGSRGAASSYHAIRKTGW